MAKAPKIYTIKVTTIRARGNDRVSEYTGTLEELVNEVFGYTLEIGNSYNSRIPRKPKTIRSLLSAVQKSSDIQYGCTYTREYFELVK